MVERKRKGDLLDLVLTTRKYSLEMEKSKVEGSHGYSGHKMVKLRILRGVSRAKSKIATLGFRRAGPLQGATWKSLRG